MDLGLQGKHAIVTRSSRGIGKAIAQAGSSAPLVGRQEEMKALPIHTFSAASRVD
jgi:NAD(P)-dependent dehydrogenase (short-subunit alcohol dehydrogenase family)